MQSSRPAEVERLLQEFQRNERRYFSDLRAGVVTRAGIVSDAAAPEVDKLRCYI